MRASVAILGFHGERVKAYTPGLKEVCDGGATVVVERDASTGVAARRPGGRPGIQYDNLLT